MERIFPISTTKEETTIKDTDGGDPSVPATAPPLLPEDAVFYYSRQNDCLRQELPEIWNHPISKKDEGGREEDDNTTSSQSTIIIIHPQSICNQAATTSQKI